MRERRNWFIRPAVANVDTLVFVAANTNPVTDPFLADRISVIAAEADCEFVLCINKTDIDRATHCIRRSRKRASESCARARETGDGIDELRRALKGQVCAFTGNSGVGKSSILNALIPGINIETGEVSERLGRGKHTTRHVELYDLGEGTFIADTRALPRLTWR